MSLEKLKQTLNYIKNITEECAVAEAVDSAFKHLESLNTKQETTSTDLVSAKFSYNILSKKNLEDLSVDELIKDQRTIEDLVLTLEEKRDELESLIDDFTILSDDIQGEIDAKEDEESEYDNGFGDTEEEEDDSPF